MKLICSIDNTDVVKTYTQEMDYIANRQVKQLNDNRSEEEKAYGIEWFTEPE